MTASPLSRLPRYPLAFLPTPLHEAPNLARALGGPRLFIKRDDLTGLAFGGNKARKLEFLVADALAQGCDTLITTGAAQSNHCRQTAAAARKCGLRCVLVLTPSHHEEFQGNILLDALLKAEVVRCSADAQAETLAQVAAEERARGNTPCVIPLGGSTGIGAMGYAAMMGELGAQLQAQSLSPAAMYFSSGSAGTHAGMFLGKRLFDLDLALLGVSPSRSAAHVRSEAAAIAAEGALLLGIDVATLPSDFDVDDAFIGPGYGISTPASLEAVRLFAEHEGILIDPVYTAKAAAAMIAHIRANRFDSDQTVLFLHTGGTPALFAYADDFA
ncbi:MAG: D-cysteine desulfhydrase family protein [Thermoflexales bacterium]